MASEGTHRRSFEDKLNMGYRYENMVSTWDVSTWDVVSNTLVFMGMMWIFASEKGVKLG